jgi:uncharacterized membrane protein
MADPVEVKESFTVLKSPEELFAFWRRLENLPAFMKHLESVEEVDAKRSHWRASAPGGGHVDWDAEIIEEEPGRLISWKSLPVSDIDNGGSVRFRPATGGRGTVVEVTMFYQPPGGKAAAGIAKIFGEEPRMQVREDLRRFKQLAETGEIPTIEGQSSGRGPDRERVGGRKKRSAEIAPASAERGREVTP